MLRGRASRRTSIAAIDGMGHGLHRREGYALMGTALVLYNVLGPGMAGEFSRKSLEL
jgi:hypothetical protein